MERFDGDSPINARIKINYSKDKPKVSFSYPRKKSQYKGSMFIPFFICWGIISFIYLSALSNQPYFNVSEDYPYKTIDKYNISDYEEFKEYYLQEDRINYFYTLYNSSYLDRIPKQRLVFAIISLVFFFGGGSLIYFPFKKKWDKLYPEYNALISIKKIAKFKPTDVKENLDKKINYPYYVEIPLFNNIVCDFNATEDFSKYLKEFEIKEHKFVYCRKKKVKFGKKKRKENEVNEWLWYARWYFSEKPKKGLLEVLFK